MTAPARPAHPFLVLGIVLTSVFVQLLDVSIVNVAIPSIQTDLGADSASIQLVLAGYQLAFACTLITAARLGDIRGRRRMFLLGMSVFTVASLLCGLAPDPRTLVAARIVQGLGSGMMFPQVLAVIQVTFSGKDRGKAFGIFGATIGLATILGPLVGGLLLKADLFGTDWRMIFLVNVPVGIGALVMAVRELPESKAPDAPKLDLRGAALVTAGLLLLVFPLTEGRERGWPWWIWVMLGLSVPVLAVFVALQVRKTRADDDPLVLMSLFGNQSFQAGVVLSAVFFLGIAPFFFAFSLYLQVGLGFTPLHSGLTTLPFAIGSGLASARSDGIAKRLGRDVLLVGTLLSTAGMVALIVVLHAAGPDLHSWEVLPVLFVAGLGLGLFVAPLSNIVLAGISGRETGSASGVLSTLQQVGGALGVALIGVILFGLLGSGAASAAEHEAGPLRRDLLAAGLPAQGSDAAVATVQDCVVRRAESGDP
ncbi:MAG: putative transrane efflux protein, partial [Frankiales bacterium]|nr:putative transrane efflux protein [Frankiales bacterium]